MRHRAPVALVAALLAGLVPVLALAALTPYSQDFEFLDPIDPDALATDGWLVFGNVYDQDMNYLYGYGPFPAPNHEFAFSAIVLDEGGLDQGLQQLVVFSDYNNVDHADTNWVEANVFQEMTIDPADVGYTWTLAFDAKRGNIAGGSTALAFIKTLDPAIGYATTNFISVDLTSTPTTWQGYTLSIDVTSILAGKILQFGFANTATLYEGSGIFYDNVSFQITGDLSSAGDAPAADVVLDQNYPNPFNPTTRIDFSLLQPQHVDLSIYDLAGRRVATLQSGELGAGAHHVTWDGRDAAGGRVASGHYRYVLTTDETRISRGMVLLK